MIKDQVIKKLDVKPAELKMFAGLKNNYDVTAYLFIKNDVKYKAVITYNDKSDGHLFGTISEDDLLYTLKARNKIIIKNASKKQIVNKIVKLLEE